MRHRRMVAPINSIKHYVSQTNILRTAGQVLEFVVSDAVAVANAGANAQDVTEGSLVKAVHMDFWVIDVGASGADSQVTAILEKIPANQIGPTLAQLANLGAYINKKNILYSFQGVLGAAVDGQATLPFIRGWFKIPLGKQRMGLGDRLVLSVVSIEESIRVCGLTTYKEYQ